MLPLMLMLIADPLAAAPAAPLASPLAEPPSVRILDAGATLRSVDQAVGAAQRDCKNGTFQQAGPNRVQAADTPSPLSDLMFHQGDPVAVTLLLERRVGQCSVPISTDLTMPDGRLPSFPARAD